MTVQLFQAEMFESVRALLKSSALPVGDLTPTHLQHFHGVSESSRLIRVRSLPQPTGETPQSS